MKLLNIGGASAIVEHAGTRMLFDPWLDDGIMHGSWYHYPPLTMGVHDLGRLDYVYISHIHEDHCSAGTIRHVNKDAEILIMDREPNFVLRFLNANGFTFKKIHLIKPRTPTRISSVLTVDMIEPNPKHEMSFLVDSMLVLEWDGFTIYNANDCVPWDGAIEYLKATYPKIDLALLPYAGGSGYPPCYTNLTDQQKAAESERIKASRAQHFIDTVRTLAPVHAMPFADQYVIAGSRANLNAYVSHPSCPGDMRRPMEETGLGDRLLLLNASQSFDLKTGRVDPPDEYKYFSSEDRDRYSTEELCDKPYDHERFELSASVSLQRLLGHARARLWTEQEKRQTFPRCAFYFDVSDRSSRYHVPLDSKTIEHVSWDAPLRQPYLRIGAPATLMALLLIGHVSWNIADAALFLDYERVPNVYDPMLYALLNYLRT